MSQLDPQIPASPIADQRAYAPWPWLEFFQRLVTRASGSIQILTVDPTDPADDTAWAYRDGGSPVETFVWRVRRNGVTYDVPWFTLP